MTLTKELLRLLTVQDIVSLLTDESLKADFHRSPSSRGSQVAMH